jgi:membrane protein implicated in regulation of membrane protease activity
MIDAPLVLMKPYVLPVPPVHPPLSLLNLAFLVGLVLGTALVGLLLIWRAAMAMRHGNSLVTSEDLVGQVGHVRLPCTPHHRGLVRLTVRGSLMDVPAYSYTGDLRKGLAVMVVELRGGDAWLTALSRARNVPSPEPQNTHD